MKIKSFLIILFLIYTTSLFAQNSLSQRTYNSYSNRIIKNRINNPNDTSTIINLFNAEQNTYGTVESYLLYLNILLNKKMYEEFENVFVNVMKTESRSFESIFSILKKDTIGLSLNLDLKDLLTKSIEAKTQFYKEKSIDYMLEIETLRTQDQYARHISSMRNLLIDKHEKEDSINIKNITNKILILTDSSNIEYCKELIEKYGLPLRRKVGEDSQFSFIVTLMHACSETETQFNKYFDYFNNIIKEMLYCREIDPEYYALFVDYCYSHIKDKQIYGMYFGHTPHTYRDFIDVENIDKLRKDIGLIELYYDSKNRGYTLPDGYKFKGE